MSSSRMNLGKEYSKEINIKIRNIRDDELNWGCDCWKGKKKVFRYLLFRRRDVGVNICKYWFLVVLVCGERKYGNEEEGWGKCLECCWYFGFRKVRGYDSIYWN